MLRFNYSIKNLKSRRFFQFIIPSVIILSLLLSSNSAVFAQQLPPLNPTQTIYFTKVTVDTSPIPNKPFKISAVIQTTNAGDLIASINAPSGVSVISPVVANLAYTNSPNSVLVSWTVMAGQPGNYPIVLQANANFPPQAITYTVNVNVGTPNSLVVTGIRVPGNIYPNSPFIVAITVQNSGTITDTNVIASINVPDGLRLDSPVSSNSSSIDVNQERTFYWRLFAQSPGSYTLTFSYSSTNSGSNSVDSDVNVGEQVVPDVSVSKISWGGTNSTSFLVGPGDQFVPLVFTLNNAGNQGLFNVNAHLLLTKPFDANASGAIDTVYNVANSNLPSGIFNTGSNFISAKDYPIGHMGESVTQSITYYVSIQKDVDPGIYLAYLKVDFSNGQDNMSKNFELPITISKTGLVLSSITVKPSLAYAGDVGDQILAQIFNSGISTNNVYAYLQLPPGISETWGNSTTADIGRITTFQSAQATFFVKVANNVTEGSYPITLILENGKVATSYPINFVVSSKANFELVSVDDSQVSPGATAIPFRVTLENVGGAAAQTVTTKLLAGNSLTGVKSSSITSVGNQENIGSVSQGQSFTTTFVVDVDPSLTGDQSTSVEIDWTQNSTGTTTPFTFVQTLPVAYHSGNSVISGNFGGIPWVYVGIGVIAIVGISVFISKRQKRKQTMDTTSLATTDKAPPRDDSDHDKKGPIGY